MSDYATDPLAGLFDEAGNLRAGVTRADLDAARRRHYVQVTQEALRQPSPAVAEPASPSYSDAEVLRHLRVKTNGEDELTVLRDLHENGAARVAENQAEIQRHREWLESRDQERAERARSESEQGRLAAAADAHDAARREAERVEMGRALLRQDPERHGVSAEMIADLTPTEVLHASGIEQTADEANDPAANRARAEGSDAA